MMTQMNSRKEENLDFGMVSMNNSNLARKADIRQYPTGVRKSGRPVQESYSEGEQPRPAHSQGARSQAAYARREQPRSAAPAVKRNPYLVNLNQGTGKGMSDSSGKGSARPRRDVDMIWGEEVEHPVVRRYGSQERSQRHQAQSAAQGRPAAAGQRQRNILDDRAGQLAREQRRLQVQAQRRRKMMQKKLIMGAVEVLAVLCIAILVYQGFFKKAEQPDNLPVTNPQENMEQMPVPAPSGDTVQGIDAAVFAKHPEWEEDFLTPNEYSRPGDPLTEVNNIFVHYTANPNTSAKQNRSYFEQQKDTHESSVSSHFIIGYNGEILQIVPMDEIAYAVMTRNQDSISIECCYKAENGQFTQETYDSLIALLSWLTEAYQLDSSDILRHYDCGGKKCPIYYTEHEDAWERLKKDVDDYTL